MHLILDAFKVYNIIYFSSFTHLGKHLILYAFSEYVDTNICLISGDVKDFDGVKDILLKKTVFNFLYCE